MEAVVKISASLTNCADDAIRVTIDDKTFLLVIYSGVSLAERYALFTKLNAE